MKEGLRSVAGRERGTIASFEDASTGDLKAARGPGTEEVLPSQHLDVSSVRPRAGL